MESNGNSYNPSKSQPPPTNHKGRNGQRATRRATTASAFRHGEHTHIHLIPLQSEGDMDFRKQRPEISKETMAQTAAAILSEYEKL